MNKRLLAGAVSCCLLLSFALIGCSQQKSPEKQLYIEESVQRKEPLYIVLLGPPGSGKSVQGKLLSKRYNIPIVSSGALLRAAATKGGEIEQCMKAGKLVPSAVITQLIEEKLKSAECKNGFILDGYPRTLEEAADLESLLKVLTPGKVEVVALKVSEKEVLDRIGKRAYCAKFNAGQLKDKAPLHACQGDEIARPDDTVSIARERFKVYTAQTAPVVNYYKHHSGILEVDATHSIEETSSILLRGLDHDLNKVK